MTPNNAPAGDRNDLLDVAREIVAVLGPNVPSSVTDTGARWEWQHALELSRSLVAALTAPASTAGEAVACEHNWCNYVTPEYKKPPPFDLSESPVARYIDLGFMCDKCGATKPREAVDRTGLQIADLPHVWRRERVQQLNEQAQRELVENNDLHMNNWCSGVARGWSDAADALEKHMDACFLQPPNDVNLAWAAGCRHGRTTPPSASSTAGEAVAWLWLQHGKPINAFLHEPGRGDEEYWRSKGCTSAPLYLHPPSASSTAAGAVGLFAALKHAIHADDPMTYTQLMRSHGVSLLRALDTTTPLRAEAGPVGAAVDALYRAVAEARGHRGALFRSDAEVIERHIATLESTETAGAVDDGARIADALRDLKAYFPDGASERGWLDLAAHRLTTQREDRADG